MKQVTMINASLPVLIEVLEKTSWWRYNLRFGTRIVSTKSQKSLEVGAKYYANIRTQSGGIININSLFKRPDGVGLNDALSLVERVFASISYEQNQANFNTQNSKNMQNLQNADFSWLFDEIKNRLLACKSVSDFEILCDMLLALKNGVISLPFAYDGFYCLAQMRAFSNALELYLLFGKFAPLIVRIRDGAFIGVATPYDSFSALLAKELKCEVFQTQIMPFYSQNSGIFNLKG